MARLVMKHDRPNCIGCAACTAIAPDFWEMGPDDKSSIKGGMKLADGTEKREIEEKDLSVNKDAAESCPVRVISIWDDEKNRKIA